MKHAVIGTALILYGLFLTPCAVDPSDLIISPAYILAATSMGVPVFIISIWIASGYIALVVGIALLGHSILRHIPAIATVVKNPVALVGLIAFVVSIVCLWVYYAA